MQKRPKIGIIISTTRPGRFADVPANWLFNIAKERDDADFEIVDLRDYPMPFFEEKMPLAYRPYRHGRDAWHAARGQIHGGLSLPRRFRQADAGRSRLVGQHAQARPLSRRGRRGSLSSGYRGIDNGGAQFL
jgi:hypothetical protein